MHRWLQRIGEDALSGWNAERVHAIAPHIQRELAATGIGGDELRAACSRVAQALTSALSEQRATLAARDRTKTHAASFDLDRSHVKAQRNASCSTARFVDDQGARWIIDYKTGTHEGADVEGFLDRERLRYSGQLELYAQALGGAAQLGLYFPLLNGWREWKSKSGEGIGGVPRGGSAPLASSNEPRARFSACGGKGEPEPRHLWHSAVAASFPT